MIYCFRKKFASLTYFIGSYERAKSFSKYVSDFGDSEGEQQAKEKKKLKRKQIIEGIQVDLRAEMKVSVDLLSFLNLKPN